MDGELVSLDRGLWTIAHPQRVGVLDFATRTTLVRLAGGELLAISPGPLATTPLDAVRALGPVAALVAPNLLHHLYLAAWSAAFPAARLYGPPGLSAKLRGVRLHEELAEKPPAAWQRDLDQVVVRGVPRMGEVVFLHRASRTLVLTDLAFNFRHGGSALTRTLMRLNDAWGHFGPSRLMRRVITRDRAALRASVDRILSWDFDRIVVAHGEVVPDGGHALLERAFLWL
jgi:hypothetical protein